MSTLLPRSEDKRAPLREMRHRKALMASAEGIRLDDSELAVLQSFSENILAVLSAKHTETLPQLGLVRAVRGGYLITPRGIAVRTLLLADRKRNGH